MIIDLALATDPTIERQAQVCIIGAGTAGIFLAQQLRQNKIEVVILEAGSTVPCLAQEVDQYCYYQGIRYRGADLGRSFGLGGTSVLWGGQMIGLTPSDMGARPAVGIPAWPISYGEVNLHIPTVQNTLGLPHPKELSSQQHSLKQNFPSLSQFNQDFQLRLSQWLPFGKRNLAKAFAPIVETDQDLQIWLNASVTGLTQSSDEPNKIIAVQAQSANGRQLTISPQILVICAGALESTRIMLAFDESSGGLITKAGAPLGRYFADHLSVTCGKFKCHHWQRYNLETSPIFEQGVMRTPRLELSPNVQEKEALTSAFAHFTFITHGDTGFDVVRNVLRRRQGEKRVVDLKPQALTSALTDVSAMAFWRGIRGRLYIPRQAELLLQVDIEQYPNWNSCLFLSDERDAFGRKRLTINWQITPDDIRVIQSVAKLAVSAWGQSSLRDIATLELTLGEQFDDFESLYDVYHPTGMLRMGNNPADSVVDPNLKVWPLKNTYISSTGVFPSAGSANPGLTHLALTARLGKHVSGLVY